MTADKTNEIRQIIEKKVEEARDRSIIELNEALNRCIEQLNDASELSVGRVNNVFGSCMKTLEQLELIDMAMFDYFWKAKGNIKVSEITPDYTELLNIRAGNVNLWFDDIKLEGKKKYRVMIIVTEA